MNNKQELSKVEAILRYTADGNESEMRKFSVIQGEEIPFDFEISETASHITWTILTNYAFTLDGVSVISNGVRIRPNKLGTTHIAEELTYEIPGEITAGTLNMVCMVRALPPSEVLEFLKNKCKEQQALIEKKQREELKFQARIRQLRTQLSNYDAIKLKAQELDTIKGSRSWKYMCKIWDLRDVLLPKGSKRRQAVKAVSKIVRHPILSLQQIKAGTFFAVPISVEKEHSLSFIKAAKEYYLPFDAFSSESPLVSIIIPVYNQFVYTYDCISSIVENSGDIPYEIIVADDCSTDKTKEIDKFIQGLRVIHNSENLRFLRNCNNAAKKAKGQYIVFLNNDTEVGENWLQPLVDLMEQDQTIGLVGSKLVYPNGQLQEAGGIVFSDASGWNYGRLDSPDMPEYNYVKDVDYISGAAIMIRTNLWKQIGGFDETFAPAYYEDTDLAFSVRKAGMRVVYQPESVVTHFEGISNGKDVTSGQKAFQEVNRKKFYEKWKNVLHAEQCSDSKELFLARDRSQLKKRLLMVDHYVPTFDKDAGSRAVYSYLRLFVRKGYHVTFIGDNYNQSQPYTEILQQMGVEVLYGGWYQQNWQSWLKEYVHFFDYAFLNRPHITVKYIDIVRANSRAKIVYFGHDLIFLREHREYEVTKEPKFQTSSEKWKKLELALMRKADVSYYPSCVEEEIVHEIDPSIHVRAVPLYQYENVPDREYNFAERQDLMFIGGYNHRPNVDAAKWFAKEIVPELVKKLPNIKIHLMGSNAPQEVIDLANEHILFEGAVSDEELAYFYAHCRVSVVPLRYGAGIKGKVLEAMSLGMPVMTTSIGAEGIAGAENILCVEDDAKLFAERLAKLYNDADDLGRRSRDSIAYIRDNFSSKKVEQVIGQDFDMG